MPIYEYQCDKCEEIFEVFHSMNEKYKDGCPKCGNKKCHKNVTCANVTMNPFKTKRVNKDRFRKSK